MDISTIYEALEDASLFELYRLQTAIGLRLDDPRKINEIKRKLRPGQKVTYFSGDENRLIEAEVIEIRRTRLSVRDLHNGKKWNLPFYYINIDNIDTELRTTSPKEGIPKSHLKIGDQVGFRDHDNNRVVGQVIRLNQKTASILVSDTGKWRVAYALLYPVIDGTPGKGAPYLLEAEILDRDSDDNDSLLFPTE
ncbi:MAG: hypothetical protein GY809_21945 [Planctomycetes bacterium]|nr:hypothetical protein [Planctomycetota bacterium]